MLNNDTKQAFVTMVKHPKLTCCVFIASASARLIIMSLKFLVSSLLARCLAFGCLITVWSLLSVFSVVTATW